MHSGPSPSHRRVRNTQFLNLLTSSLVAESCHGTVNDCFVSLAVTECLAALASMGGLELDPSVRKMQHPGRWTRSWIMQITLVGPTPKRERDDASYSPPHATERTRSRINGMPRGLSGPMPNRVGICYTIFSNRRRHLLPRISTAPTAHRRHVDDAQLPNSIDLPERRCRMIPFRDKRRFGSAPRRKPSWREQAQLNLADMAQLVTMLSNFTHGSGFNNAHSVYNRLLRKLSFESRSPSAVGNDDDDCDSAYGRYSIVRPNGVSAAEPGTLYTERTALTNASALVYRNHVLVRVSSLDTRGDRHTLLVSSRWENPLLLAGHQQEPRLQRIHHPLALPVVSRGITATVPTDSTPRYAKRPADQPRLENDEAQASKRPGIRGVQRSAEAEETPGQADHASICALLDSNVGWRGAHLDDMYPIADPDVVAVRLLQSALSTPAFFAYASCLVTEGPTAHALRPSVADSSRSRARFCEPGAVLHQAPCRTVHQKTFIPTNGKYPSHANTTFECMPPTCSPGRRDAHVAASLGHLFLHTHARARRVPLERGFDVYGRAVNPGT
ncbi:hypothetical protein PMIN01_10946 [Paraphaeosphaeria minitans]|uniref:Uncharacterized protein n=1 Tax=Paraphaeosphaeria minitans TaxID=565426 RepID=A0A9P6KKZ2_9PLEO|nr:hypothetical protein PMIN01_10946 [Paraphaeosphaeria minitans]